MTVVRCLSKFSTEAESSELREHSPRYSFKGCRCLFKVAFSVIRQILASCRDVNIKDGGRGRVNSISSLIKSWPAIKGDGESQTVKAYDVDLVMKRSRVVWDCVWLWVSITWWVSSVDITWSACELIKSSRAVVSADWHKIFASKSPVMIQNSYLGKIFASSWKNSNVRVSALGRLYTTAIKMACLPCFSSAIMYSGLFSKVEGSAWDESEMHEYCQWLRTYTAVPLPSLPFLSCLCSVKPERNEWWSVYSFFKKVSVNAIAS